MTQQQLAAARSAYVRFVGPLKMDEHADATVTAWCREIGITDDSAYPRAYTTALPEGARVVIKSDPYHQHPTPGLCVVASGVEQFLGCRA